MADVIETRRFSVQARHLDVHHARTLQGASFEAAAVAYVEDLHELGETAEISVIVRDLDSGREHCFRIDLEAGTAASCG